MLRTGIERDLSDRNISVTRRVATLSGERQIVAPFFLGAGFEAIPADEEDVQAAAIMCSAVYSPNPPDEIVFMLGIDEPVNLLRSLAGRARRVFLRLSRENYDYGLTESLGRALEGVLDVREILSKEGVNWDRLELRTWDSWSRQFERLLLGSDELDDATEESATALEAETATDASETSETSDAEDELVRLQDVYREFQESAPRWNEALEKILLELDLRCSAYKATEQLDYEFPGLNNFFLNRREEFESLLSPNIKLITDKVEGNNVYYLYHVTHSEMRPADLEGLTFGGGATSEFSPVDATTSQSPQKYLDDATTFSRLAVRVNFLKRQSEWSAQRIKLVESGASFEESIKPRDLELAQEGKDLEEYAWQRRTDISLKSEDFALMGELYAKLERALRVMSAAAGAREVLPTNLVARVMQALVNAQCLIKSGLSYFLSPFGLKIFIDISQKDVFETISEYRKEYFPREYLHNMGKNDVLDFDERFALDDELDKLEEELDSRISANKERKRCEDKLRYHLKKLRENRERQDDDDWKKVVETTTELCDRFFEPYSSLLLRKLLADVLDDMPENLEETESFARVVQEIQWAAIQEEERQREEFEFARAESPEISPEVQTVRELCSGKKVVFIGGTPKDHLKKRLESAFDCELVWFETSHSVSNDRYEPLLRSPDVALLIVYIPWCSHKHSEELMTRAKEYGKEYARARKGTNPEQIARAVVDQLNLAPNDSDVAAGE